MIEKEFEDGLLLVRPEDMQPFVLNSSGMVIWRHISQGRAASEAAEELVKAFGIPLQLAIKDTEAALEQWTQTGLIGDSGKHNQKAPGHNLNDAPAFEEISFHSRRTYSFMGRIFSARYSSRLLEFLAHPKIAGFEVRNMAPEWDVSIVDCGGFYTLYKEGRAKYIVYTEEKIVGALFGAIRDFVYPDEEWLILTHGAAIGRDGRAALMPAYFGSGKSTLTASLVKSGFRYFSDDMAPLTSSATPEVAPFPVDLCLKEGSWAPLAPFYPELGGLEPGCKGDGRAVKYIPVPQNSMAEAPAPVKFLLFPSYQPGSRAEFEPLSMFETLSLISGSSSPVMVSEENMELLVDWVRNTPSFLFRLDNLPEAVEAFTSLWEGP